MSSKKKGFTLAELLIVVAIIGVLVAISIPVFTSQLEKSREAADLANVRAAYAEVMAAAIGEDAEAEYNGVKIKQTDAEGNVLYTATVDLEQGKAGWTTKVPIEIGDVLFTGTEIEGKWVGSPCVEGTCEVSYTTAGGTSFVWSGDFTSSSSGSSASQSVYNSIHDYFQTIAAGVGKGIGSYCLNSTCSNNGTIKNVISGVSNQEDTLFDNDIATWAVIRDTTLERDVIKQNNNNSYLLSTFDITEMSAGTDVPAIYYLADGTYQVGYATVTLSSDPNGSGGEAYNIITREQDGDYAYTYTRFGGSGTPNKNYDYTNVLKDTTTYTSLEEAQAAYKQLAGQYMDENPGVVEGNQ